MKYLIFLVAGLFSIAAQAQQTTLGMGTNAGAVPLQTIKLSGTVTVQENTTPSTARARVQPLNEQRVFAEFSVSKHDYELVLDVNGAGTVELVGKSASAALPTLQVFMLSGNAPVLDTKLNFGDLYANVGSTATGNLFEGLAGSGIGKVSFKGPIANGVFKKFTFSSLALGKNQKNVSSPNALLKFKVVTTGDFTQKP